VLADYRRIRSLTGTFVRTEIAIPHARVFGAGGKTAEWQSKVAIAYQRRTRAAAQSFGKSTRQCDRILCY
jgi:hypothetical protein